MHLSTAFCNLPVPYWKENTEGHRKWIQLLNRKEDTGKKTGNQNLILECALTNLYMEVQQQQTLHYIWGML